MSTGVVRGSAAGFDAAHGDDSDLPSALRGGWRLLAGAGNTRGRSRRTGAGNARGRSRCARAGDTRATRSAGPETAEPDASEYATTSCGTAE
ncbi:hypothetical protein GCM10027068_23330 [Prescottella soli]